MSESCLGDKSCASLLLMYVFVLMRVDPIWVRAPVMASRVCRKGLP